MSNVFVFSTRFLGEGKAFSKRKDLTENSLIREYLINHFWNDSQRVFEGYKASLKESSLKEQLKSVLRLNDEDLSSIDNENFKVIYFDDPVQREILKNFFIEKKIVTDRMREELVCCPGNTDEEKFDSRFSYYCLTEAEDDNSVIAVPHLGWRAEKEWVFSLIKEVATVDNDVYLVLHDNDVPNYDHNPYKILTDEDVNEVLKDDNGKKLAVRSNIHIVVFQHTWNDVVMLLKNGQTKKSDIESRFSSDNNYEKLKFFFSSLSTEANERKSKLKELSENLSVDICDNSIDKHQLSPDVNNDNIYYYSDVNGALLTDLMHVQTDIRNSKNIIEFIKILTRKEEKEETTAYINIDALKQHFPLVVKIYKSFFSEWKDAVDNDDEKKKIHEHPNYKALEENLRRVFSFFNNSSIFVRVVDMFDNKAYEMAVAEFKYFEKIGLYEKYDSAWENLHYNLRIQLENYLFSSIGGHGNYVTPILYGDERKSLDILVSNNQTLDNNDQPKTDSENNQQSDIKAQQPTSSEKNQQSTPWKKLWGKIKSLGKNIEDKKKSSEYTGDGTTTQEKNSGDEDDQQPQVENDTVLFKEKEELEEMFKHMKHFHDITFRALLIDDKVCGEDKKEGYIKLSDFNKDDQDKKSIKVVSCDDNKCEKCDDNPQCKLKTIKQLMDTGKKEKKTNIFTGIGETKDYFYWKESGIKTFYCPNIIEDFIENDNALDFSNLEAGINVYSAYHAKNESDPQKQMEKEAEEEKKRRKDGAVNIKCDLVPEINKNDLHVQIVGVRDVRTALLLLSKYKFDMIFSDYLLDYKDEKQGTREYANQLFSFLAHDYKKELKEEGKSDKCKFLDKLRHDVLDNRGPLGQMWIMPITGFNQTFIQDIYRNGTNLIDYKWNISNGVDPITTPWQFLYHLNMFIELQLRSSVYKTEQLLQFLKYTCDDLEEMNNAQEDKKKKLNFDDFKSFMGSEYATFTQLYGNRLPIKRDALINKDVDNNDSKSVFASYVWNKFYSNKDYYDVVELCRLMHRFYYLASYMYNDRIGVQRLNEAFANLDFFVRTNRRIKFVIEEEENKDKIGKLEEKLTTLREIISKYTNNQQDKRN